MSNVLIIDDDLQTCDTLVKIFTKIGHKAFYSLTLKEGLDNLFSNEFDVVFLDVKLPDGNGLEAVETIKCCSYMPEIIIITGAGSSEGAEFAMKSGVWDYIPKTGSYKEFQFILTRALEYRAQKKSNLHELSIKRKAIIGNSSPIRSCIEKISNAANNNSPVLITGETGSGKELFAKAIHENSFQQQNKFIVVDCATLPEHLVESVLFGHSKGAFTGADSDKTGLMKLADKGTLFLDEVGELPLVIQKKFLRALQEKRFRPVGSKDEVSSNFRLITATHRDLMAMVKQEKFREDLYFRIAAIKIEIPPLRDRKSDIAALVANYIDQKKELYNESPHKVSEEFIEDLLLYDWPGNVRELFNIIDSACSEAFRESILFPKHLPENIRIFNIKKKMQGNIGSVPKPCATENQSPIGRLGLKDYIEAMKHGYVKDLMSHAKGDIKTACRLSDLSRGHLYALLKKYNISDL